MQLRSGRSISKSAAVPVLCPASTSPVPRPAFIPLVLRPMKLRSGRSLCTPAPDSVYHKDVSSADFQARKREIVSMVHNRINEFEAVKAKHHKQGLRIQSRTYYVECARAIIELFGVMNEYFDDIKYYFNGVGGNRFLKTVKAKAFELQLDLLAATSEHRFRGADGALIYNTADELHAFIRKTGKRRNDL